MSKYDPSQIEKKWQAFWEKEKIYKTPEPSSARPKKYILDMFPYPSGAQLHVGHMEGYVGTDLVSRYLRMKGHSVLHPMGWDAFGLPAENYAIQTGIHPDKSTHNNIKTFRKQLKLLGLSYDWTREVDTSDPEYYQWTQWLFILLFKNGLAYKKLAPANWCPKDETVLANEQVEEGRCERCGSKVLQKEIAQWFFKITDYADRLIAGLGKIDWPESTKQQQENWIGRKEGTLIKFKIQNAKFKIGEIEVFTTRPDTVFGATFLVLAPEHGLTKEIIPSNKDVLAYVEKVKTETELEREHLKKEKTGVDTAIKAINPVNGESIPVFVADYVLATAGTGAIMGVPAHDQRDFEFVKKFRLPIRVVVAPSSKSKTITQAYTGSGKLINSGSYTTLSSQEAQEKITGDLEKNGQGGPSVSYHLRDWLVSRQRYWGAPIPMIYCETCARDKRGEKPGMPGWYTVREEDLPIRLPTDVDFEPKGESPIAKSKSFQEGVVCPSCGSTARREVDTMDTFVDSSWYFLRYLDPDSNKEFASGSEIKKWMPVDIYVGGGHTVQHLLYARFFFKVLYDSGLIDKSIGDEPFTKLRAPGWILGPDSRKMSKRWNNVITPDDVVAKYGADTMRIYEMFMAPFEVDKPWNVDSVAGAYRFLSKVYKLFQASSESLDRTVNKEVSRDINRLIRKVGYDIETLNFNTAVAAMMEFINKLIKANLDRMEGHNGGLKLGEVWQRFLLVLAPFAPHLAEEMWSLGFARDKQVKGEFVSIHQQSWPQFDKKLAEREDNLIVISINGKPRSTMVVASETEQEIKEKALRNPRVARYTEGKKITRTVFVPGKILNLVVE